MSATPTASHAYNLFSLTMESRFGSGWRATVPADTISALAEEIVVGFGGKSEDKVTTVAHSIAPVQWRFPDGSRASTGSFGLRREEAEERAA